MKTGFIIQNIKINSICLNKLINHLVDHDITKLTASKNLFFEIKQSFVLIITCIFLFASYTINAETYTFNNTSTGESGTIQEWTVPFTGNYQIEAYGAQGGNSGTKVGGKGAKMSGTFQLTQGEVIKILVGQQGIGWHNPSFWGYYRIGGAGGGGGSFVVRSPYNTTGSILVIAGGGGGAHDCEKGANDGKPGLTGTSGSSSNITGSGTGWGGSAHGGSNGNGGGIMMMNNQVLE